MNRKNLLTRWQWMKGRCNNVNNAAYKDYWGRWIQVCERWMDFENFYNDMSPGFKEWLTLDRIDNDWNYEPSNCRWATMWVQSNNRRQSPNLRFYWKTQSLNKWAKELGISRDAVYQKYKTRNKLIKLQAEMWMSNKAIGKHWKLSETTIYLIKSSIKKNKHTGEIPILWKNPETGKWENINHEQDIISKQQLGIL